MTFILGLTTHKAVVNLYFSAYYVQRTAKLGFSGGTTGKNPLANAGDVREWCRFEPWVRKISWRKAWHPTVVFLPGESYGQSSLGGCSPWGCRESGMTEAV